MKTCSTKLDLTKYMIEFDNKNSDEDLSWDYHHEALKEFTHHIDILGSVEEDDYQGECFALLRTTDQTPIYILWRDSFGSCSGCDRLIDSTYKEAYDYIKATLREGNTRQFNSLDEAFNYIKDSEPTDYAWNQGKTLVIKMLEDYKHQEGLKVIDDNLKNSIEFK